MKERDTASGEERPQLQIWDDEDRETAIGTLVEDDVEWELVVVLEPMDGDLFRGRLSFRSGEERYDTAPVLVEDSPDGVVRRAGELPRSTLRQFLLSTRD